MDYKIKSSSLFFFAISALAYSMENPNKAPLKSFRKQSSSVQLQQITNESINILKDLHALERSPFEHLDYESALNTIFGAHALRSAITKLEADPDTLTGPTLFFFYTHKEEHLNLTSKKKEKSSENTWVIQYFSQHEAFLLQLHTQYEKYRALKSLSYAPEVKSLLERIERHFNTKKATNTIVDWHITKINQECKNLLAIVTRDSEKSIEVLEKFPICNPDSILTTFGKELIIKFKEEKRKNSLVKYAEKAKKISDKVDTLRKRAELEGLLSSTDN